MDEIVLHHSPTLTFSERVRLAFGLKNVAWRSVTIPPAMPKSDLLPLMGGYRRTPVMQIGADILCDTQLILRKSESLRPDPSLYPDGSEWLVLRGDPGGGSQAAARAASQLVRSRRRDRPRAPRPNERVGGARFGLAVADRRAGVPARFGPVRPDGRRN